jgi:hypothetical protein
MDKSQKDTYIHNDNFNLLRSTISRIYLESYIYFNCYLTVQTPLKVRREWL